MVDNKKFRINKIDIFWEDDSQSHLLTEFRITNLLAVGEVHGVIENLQLYYMLIKLLKIRVLALELHPEYKNFINSLLKTGKIPSVVNTLEDGRFSLEHVELLKLVGQLVDEVILFDNSQASMGWNERDKAYADTFLSKFDVGKPTLLVAGNLHTKTELFKTAFEADTLVPMGHHIVKSIGEFPIMRLKYGRGKFYNFGVQEINKVQDKDIKPITIKRKAPNKYVCSIDIAHPVTI